MGFLKFLTSGESHGRALTGIIETEKSFRCIHGAKDLRVLGAVLGQNAIRVDKKKSVAQDHEHPPF